MLVYHRVNPCIMSPVLKYTPAWTETVNAEQSLISSVMKQHNGRDQALNQ